MNHLVIIEHPHYFDFRISGIKLFGSSPKSIHPTAKDLATYLKSFYLFDTQEVIKA